MRYRLARDGDQRPVEFSGELLARADTDDGRLRWTDAYVYRTDAGQYVFRREGRSRVYHLTPGEGGCPTTNGRTVPAAMLTDDEFDAAEPCPRCSPRDLADLETEADTFTFESTNRHVDVCATPADLERATTSRDPDSGQRFVNRVTRQVLARACDRDPALAEHFAVERVA